ncbi:MAG: hypothetical protein COB35_12825 [Gammaproteobacteria bacterium]|nr:MAG: hypothetical protein COB35_12825 [Gammaproteobacteria bacterium]
MALKATVFKVQLQIADIDRGYYQDHTLTIAQHPSENNERMMVRLLAFMINASNNLTFSKGMSVEDEPELCQKSLCGEIELWIAFGQSDEKWLRKASGRAKQVQLFTYAGRSVPIWWQQNQQALERYRNLTIWNIPEGSVTALGQMAARKMSLQCNISEGQIWLSDATSSIMIEPVILKEFAE